MKQLKFEINPLVGRILARQEKSVEITEKVNFLYFSVEATMKLISCILISYYWEKGFFAREVESEIAKLQRPAAGHWLAVIRVINAQFGNENDFPVDKELFRAYASAQKENWDKVAAGYLNLAERLGGERKSTVSAFDFMEKMIVFRNKVMGHGTLPKEIAVEWYAVLKEAIYGLIDSIQELKNYKLFYLSGIVIEKGETFGRFMAIETDDSYPVADTIRIHEKMKDGRVYLTKVRGEQRQFLCLHPLIIFAADQNRLYIMNESGKRKEFLNYESGSHLEPQELPGNLDGMTGILSHQEYKGKVFSTSGYPLIIIRGAPGVAVTFGHAARREKGDGLDNDVVFRFSDISRVHMKLTVSEKGFFIEDSASRWGVMLNERRIAPNKPECIADKMMLQLGMIIRFNLIIDEKGNLIMRFLPPSPLKKSLLKKEQQESLPDDRLTIVIVKSQKKLEKFNIPAEVGISDAGIVVLTGTSALRLQEGPGLV